MIQFERVDTDCQTCSARRTAPNPERAAEARRQAAGAGRGNAPLGGAPPANE